MCMMFPGRCDIICDSFALVDIAVKDILQWSADLGQGKSRLRVRMAFKLYCDFFVQSYIYDKFFIKIRCSFSYGSVQGPLRKIHLSRRPNYELLSRNYEFVIRNYELVIRNDELVSRNNKLLIRNYDLLIHNYDLNLFF